MVKAKKVKVGGGKPGSSDARNKIIAKSRSKMVDARDKLVRMSHAQGVDARSKITKIRNLKKGMLDVKTTSGGAITITKTTKGQTLLTTKKKAKSTSYKPGGGGGDRGRGGSNKNVTRTVGRGGTISLKTKNKTQSTLTGVAKAKPPPPKKTSSSARPRNLTRTIKGEMSEAAKLDMELLNTKVDPIILKRTVNQDVGRHHHRDHRRMSPPPMSLPAPFRSSLRRRSPSPMYSSRMRSRSRSPIDVDMYDGGRRGGGRGGGYHFDDPRRELEREEAYARRLQMQDMTLSHPLSHSGGAGRTMADRFGVSSSTGPASADPSRGMGISPLEGAKVVVSNLQTTVSKEDLYELFGDVGALKRVKVSSPGAAEVVFVERADAQKAVEIYHNRQLDGKAMKCQIVGSGGLEPSAPNSSYRLPGGGSSGGGVGKESRRSDARAGQIPTVELNSIHRALFNDRNKQGGGGGGADDRYNRNRHHRETSRDRTRSRRY